MVAGPANGRHLSPVVLNAIAVVVAAVWAVSFVADILVATYSPPSGVHLALMTVLGGTFGSQFVRKT